MANLNSALIFPETVPSSHAMAELLIFFEALFYYLPTESDAPDKRGGVFSPTLAVGYSPVPLGDDLSRFNRLLRQMETGRPDEFSRLSSLAGSPMGTGRVRDQDETSVGGIFSALHRDDEAKTSAIRRERLWQARLILKLAEILDRRETEVRQGLAQIFSLEQKLFASLEGPGDAETDEPAILKSRPAPQQPKADDMPDKHPSGSSGRFIPRRVKAWAELYLADSADPQSLLPVAPNPESGSILLDGYEITWRRTPEKLFSLTVPAFLPAENDATGERFISSRNAFRDSARENLEYFTLLLRETASSSGSTPVDPEEVFKLGENVSAWEKKIKSSFPCHETGVRKLDFYAFPGISFRELLQRLFHLEEAAGPKKPEYPTAIAAILNP